MTQPAWTLTDKEKIKKTLELIEDFENSGSSKHYKANAQKMRIMLDAITVSYTHLTLPTIYSV